MHKNRRTLPLRQRHYVFPDRLHPLIAYQLLFGGSGAEDATIGQIMGPGFGAHEIADAVERVVNFYLKQRGPGERFLDTYRRVGMEPFKNVAYQEQMNAAYNG